MRPPCPCGCEAGRDGQGLLGCASGGPAGGRRVAAAPRVAPTRMTLSQVVSAPCAVATRRERFGGMRPPCPRGCDAGRDGQGLLGWASGGPAGGRRVGAAPRIAPTHMALSQVVSAAPSPRVESALGRCAHRVLVDAMLDVKFKGTTYPPMPTKLPWSVS